MSIFNSLYAEHYDNLYAEKNNVGSTTSYTVTAAQSGPQGGQINAGNFNNGMPMTSSMGCGIWGGNITNENVALKHYLNITWVSRPTPEDRPSDAELFGEFYRPTLEASDDDVCDYCFDEICDDCCVMIGISLSVVSQNGSAGSV